MDDLTTYRIDREQHDAHDGSYTGEFPDPISFLIDDGVLVRDTRLQAIADAASEPFMYCFTHGQRRVQCEWATVLHECSDVDDAVILRRSLLDTLEGEQP